MVKLVVRPIGPKDINREFDNLVIGQTAAKRMLSNAGYQHLVNCTAHTEYNKFFSSMRPVPMIIGESGNGKTFLIRKLSSILKKLTETDLFPVLEIDCTQLSPTGIVGQSFEDILSSHYDDYRHNPQALASTIVYLDEIDKLCNNLGTTHSDDMHADTQYSLLKFIEGGGTLIQTNKGGNVNLDTSTWLFVFSGNFPKVRMARDNAKSSTKTIGFTTHEDKSESLESKLHIKRLLQDAGMKTQLTGRITTVSEITKLTDEELIEICKRLIVPELEEFFHFTGSSIHITEEDIALAVKNCGGLKLGARGLKGELEKIIEEHIFESKFDLNIYVKDDPKALPLVSSIDKFTSQIDLETFAAIQSELNFDPIDKLYVDEYFDDEDYSPIEDNE